MLPLRLGILMEMCIRDSVQTARANGAAATGGMAMLVWQAAVAHEIWDGVTYDPEIIHTLVDEMEDYVEHDFGK